MAKKKNNHINLLPKDEFEISTLGRVLKWLLGTFRFIVIFTEMIVMIAFLSRFWLDAKSNDLNAEIKQKQVLISSYAPVETEFTVIQKRMLTLTQFSTESVKPSELIDTIVPLIPSDIKLNLISASELQNKFEGESLSEKAIAQLIANLENSKKFTKISLGEISSKKDSNSLIFTLELRK